jgi:hypothetical protein
MNREELLDLEQTMMKPEKCKKEEKDLFFDELPKEIVMIRKLLKIVKDLDDDMESFIFYKKFGFEKRSEKQKFASETPSQYQIWELQDDVQYSLNSINANKSNLLEARSKFYNTQSEEKNG